MELSAHLASYPAPMDEIEPGVMIIQDKFLKEIIERIKIQDFDLSARQLGDGMSHVVELTVRHTVESHQVSTLCHSAGSNKANKYLEPLRQKIAEIKDELDKSV